MRELRRSIAQHVMATKGYTGMFNKQPGWSGKDRNKEQRPGYAPLSRRSFFAMYWRDAMQMRPYAQTRDVANKRKKKRAQ